MNTKAIYRQAASLPKQPEPTPPEDTGQQILLNDAATQWLTNPLTIKLQNFLLTKRSELLEEAVNCVLDEEKTKSKLHKAAILKEIIEYARNNTNT